MSTQTATTYDVFLSYPITETGLADSVTLALEQAGLDVFRPDKVEPTGPWQDTIWRAQVECAALIVIVPSESPLAPSVAVEVGAFKAWRKTHLRYSNCER